MASKAKKEGAGNAETDRKNVIKQMKVKTTLKTDKSWINQKSAEERTDGNASPLSPQLKSLEGRKIFWSPTSDDKDNRVSSAFRDKDNLTRISSNPVQASNRPSGSRLSTGYIIRGQPLSGTEKTLSSFNGYQKSYTGQTKSASLPRVPPASGYKMSTDTYKKLAPFNTRKSVGDLSDDETFSSEEQTKRTEAASGVLKDASIKERSYVFSAAKRNFETGVQDNNPSQFLAKRVEVKEEPTDKKRETSSKTLSSYLLEDAKCGSPAAGSPKLNHRVISNTVETSISTNKSDIGKITVGKYESGSPKLITRNLNSSSEKAISSIKPESGKITVVQEQSGSPKLMTRNINSSSEKAISSIKPEPGKITVVQEQSETISPSSPKLTTRNTRSTVETNVSTIGSEPGKSNITDYSTGVKKEKSTKVSGDIPKLTSWTTSHVTEYTKPDSRATPGKITVIPDESTAHNTNNGGDLISWSDLDETPSSVQAQDKSEKPKMDSSMIVSSNRPTPRSRDTVTTRVTESRYRDPGSFDNNTNGTSSHTTVSTTRSTDPTYIEYLEGNDSRSTRNKGVFVKEYVDTSENFRSPTHSGSQPDYFGGSEKSSYSSSSYLYSSAPRRVDEGPCTYCGRQIKDCAIIKLDNPSIYCHEYCFKCGICKKQMGDLMDSIFIHRDVVHCESCYEKLF
ncbi:hypothetical protein GDO86_015445 [Hymenochirus boettgeri]|uniref:LIM zinc-binding domain-containing protein n=1 Tax=Hymenochirus boettgeri TaxID=247094 RepID=A0A8T2JYU3_9PIPI|nr:hypothetical protein GDO86_015445 [Hymenochirus boettgeri]